MMTQRNSNTEIPQEKKPPVKPRKARPKTTRKWCQSPTACVTRK